MKLKAISYVEEVPYGVYVWSIDKRPVMTESGDYIAIAAVKGDRVKQQELRDFAANNGITEGEPMYMSGRRPITDEEYQEQLTRMKLGLVPDPLDVAANADERRFRYEK